MSSKLKDTSQIKLINYGSIYGPQHSTGHAGQTWSPMGLCPTLQTMQGGNRQPLIVVGSTQKHAYIGDMSYSPTLTEAMGCGGGQIPMVIEEVDK